GALVPDRILADLDDHIVAGFEGLLDLAVLATESGGLPVHLAGVEHPVTAAADVDERRLHRRQHVLHDAEIDVADQRRRGRRGDEVLDHHAVFEHGDLGVAGALMGGFGADLVPHNHHAFDRFAARQELGLAQDRRAAPARVATVATALPLAFQPGRPGDALNLGVGLVPFLLLGAGDPFADDGVRRVVRRHPVVGVVPGTGLPPTPAATTSTRALGGGGLIVTAVVRPVVGLVALVGVALVGGRGGHLLGVAAAGTGGIAVGVVTTLFPASTAPAPPATPAPACRGAPTLVVVPVRTGVGPVIAPAD